MVFAGTPAFAVPTLEALCTNPAIDVVAVYTQPDRAAGRGRQLQLGAVKAAALARGLRVEQPETLRNQHQSELLASLAPDLLIVVAYGLLLPNAILEIPRVAALNVHASLLPRWRGAAPIQRAIMAGDQETGVTIMRIVEALDAGPMLLKKACAIEGADTAGTLQHKLSLLGAETLNATLAALATGTHSETPQDDRRATYARKIERDDRTIDWNRSAISLEQMIRALNPSPLAVTTLGRLSVNVWRAEVVTATTDAPPGSILSVGNTGVDIATGDGLLRLTELQPQGKRAMSAREFNNGYGRQLLR